jgi:hypothetical protein
MRLLTAIALFLALALLAACGDDDGGGGASPTGDATPAHTGPHVRGEITSFEPYVEGESDGGMRIDGAAEPDTVYARAVATFNEDTDVFRREGDEEVEASLDDLALGIVVEVTFTGPIAESDPVVGTASKIVILED